MKIHKEINYSFFREGYALAVAEILRKNECDQVIKILLIMQVHRTQLELTRNDNSESNFHNLIMLF